MVGPVVKRTAVVAPGGQVSMSVGPPDEEALLVAASRGDAAACRALVVRHQRAVFAQLRAMLAPVGRGAVVEDLAQEAFLRAFRALPRFVKDRRAKFKTWMLTITTRVALNELRRRRQRTQELDTVSEALASRRDDPAVGSALIGPAIEAALRELPDGFRAAFVLRELHDLDYGEIAKMLEIDRGTVKSRLSRARSRLREALAEVDHE